MVSAIVGPGNADTGSDDGDPTLPQDDEAGDADTSVIVGDDADSSGLIVVDNTDDIDRLEDIGAAGQPVLIRVLPGVRPDTYDAVATGQAGSKFGLPLPAARALGFHGRAG